MKKNTPEAKPTKNNRYAKSIELLNRAINDEMAAVHQYMYFHFHCDDQNFDLLSGLFRRTAIQEMMHVEQLAERVLFLKGEVIMKAAGEVAKIIDVEKMLEMAQQMEDSTVLDYNRWAMDCAQNADSASKKIFEDLVLQEEIHRDQFENEIDNLKNFGKNYLVLQSMERSKNVAAAAPTTTAV